LIVAEIYRAVWLALASTFDGTGGFAHLLRPARYSWILALQPLMGRGEQDKYDNRAAASK
jgi:hypothetical protein